MKKVVPKLKQEVKVKVNTSLVMISKFITLGNFQDFTARYIINSIYSPSFCRGAFR